MFYIDVTLLKEIQCKLIVKVKINGLFSFNRTNIANSIIRGLWVKGILSSLNMFMSQDTLIGDCKSILNMPNLNKCFSGPLFKGSITILEFENKCNFHMEYFTFLLGDMIMINRRAMFSERNKSLNLCEKTNHMEHFIVWSN